jgi:hypothetical protein
VDYKTVASEPDPLQVAIYVKAVKEIWEKHAQPRWLSLRTARDELPKMVPELDRLLGRLAAWLQTFRRRASSWPPPCRRGSG